MRRTRKTHISPARARNENSLMKETLMRMMKSSKIICTTSSFTENSIMSSSHTYIHRHTTAFMNLFQNAVHELFLSCWRCFHSLLKLLLIIYKFTSRLYFYPSLKPTQTHTHLVHWNASPKSADKTLTSWLVPYPSCRDTVSHHLLSLAFPFVSLPLFSSSKRPSSSPFPFNQLHLICSYRLTHTLYWRDLSILLPLHVGIWIYELSQLVITFNMLLRNKHTHITHWIERFSSLKHEIY